MSPQAPARRPPSAPAVSPTPITDRPDARAIQQRVNQLVSRIGAPLAGAMARAQSAGAGTRDNYVPGGQASNQPGQRPSAPTNVTPQVYMGLYSGFQPKAILPRSNRVVDPATDTEPIPDNVATTLFNSIRQRIQNTSTYVARARWAIETAERYYRGLTGAASSANGLSTLFPEIDNIHRQTELAQPPAHHHHMTLREGSVIQGLFARIPAAQVGPLDRDSEHQVEAAEAADRVLQSLLGGLDAAELQVSLIRKLYTGGNVFAIADEADYGYDDPSWKVPVWTFTPYTQMIQPAVMQCENVAGKCPMSVGQIVPELSVDEQGSPYPTEPPPPPEKGSPAAPAPEDIPSQSQPAQCPLCGSPAQILTPVLVRHQVATKVASVWAPGLEVSVEDALTITVPVMENFDDATWLLRTRYQPVGKILSRFQELRKNWRVFGGGSGSDLAPSYNYWYSNYAAEVRSMITSGTISVMNDRQSNWQVDEVWMDACDFHCLEADSDGETAAWMAERFPHGAKLTFVQRRLVEIRHACLHKQVFMFRSDAGSGTYANPMANPVIAANRVADLAISLMLRAVRNGIPMTFYRQSVLAPETVRKMAHGHVDHVPIGPNVPNMKDVIYQTTPPAPPQSISALSEYADQSIRPVMGTTDPIVGEASSSVETTLGGDQLRLTRALTRHHPLWVLIRKGWAFIDTALLRLAVEKVGEVEDRTPQQAPSLTPMPGMPLVPPQPPTSPKIINQIVVGGCSNGLPGKLDISLEEKSKILEGGWKIEIEENLPLTSAQIQAAITTLLESQSPVVQQLLTGDSRNLGILQKYLLPAGFYQPQQDAIEQVRRFIKWLREDGAPPMENGEPAIDPILSQALGKTVLRASRPVSAADMDPMLCYDVVMQWCKSPAGRAARGSGIEPRPEYNNVLIWGQHNKDLAEYQMLQAQMAQQAQMQAQGQAGQPGQPGQGGQPGGESSGEQDQGQGQGQPPQPGQPPPPVGQPGAGQPPPVTA